MKRVLFIAFIFTTLLAYSEENQNFIEQSEKVSEETVSEPVRTITFEQLENMETAINREENRAKLQQKMALYTKTFNEYVEAIKNDEGLVFEAGDRFFKKRKYSKSAKIFSLNESARNLFGAATSYRFLGNYKTAINFYNKTLAINPDISEAYFGRGISYRNLGNYGKAKADIKRYMSYSPKLEGYLALGDIYLAEKNKEAAKDILQEAIRLYPNSKELERMLKTSYLK